MYLKCYAMNVKTIVYVVNKSLFAKFTSEVDHVSCVGVLLGGGIREKLLLPTFIFLCLTLARSPPPSLLLYCPHPPSLSFFFSLSVSVFSSFSFPISLFLSCTTPFSLPPNPFHFPLCFQCCTF